MELSILGILFGILFGVLGFLPLYLASRSVTPASDTNVVALAIACVGFPLILLSIAIFICSRIAPGALLCFGLAMAVTLLMLTMVYACWYFMRRR